MKLFSVSFQNVPPTLNEGTLAVFPNDSVQRTEPCMSEGQHPALRESTFKMARLAPVLAAMRGD